MRHAVYLPPFGAFGDVHALVELAQTAEDSGWDGFFLWDHIQYEEPVPLCDAWIALSASAVATSRIRLGPLVTPLPRRRPWKVAREAVTLDHLSRGRVVLGVGLGIDFWGEFGSFDGEADNDAERAALLNDGLEIITQLWTGEPTTFNGTRLSVNGAHFLPQPLQKPRIPIWAAALWPAKHPGPVERAARCDGVFPFAGGPITPEETARVQEAVAAERATDEPFDLCVWGDADQAAAFEQAGATWLIESIGPEDTVAHAQQTIRRGPPR